MSFQIRFSPKAVQDINEVLDFTGKQFGERQHATYQALIDEALANIADDPNRPPAKTRPELHRDARIFHLARHGKRARHFFVYRIFSDKHVDVSRLLHDSVDLQRHLPEGFRPETED